MSKELYFTDGNNEVKYLDTTASFNLAITQDGSAFDLTNATAIDVKVANDTGYVFDKSIDMTTITQPLAGLITMPVDAEVMNALVPDDYTIEVWVTLSSLVTPGSQEGLTDDGSTTENTTPTTTTYNAIFPSDDPQGFSITDNVMSDSGDVIPVMSLDAFQQEFDQLKTDLTNQVSTLQGPKGDPGQGLEIKGKVNTTSQLPKTASEGDGYLVGEELYIWTNSAWKDCGPIQGPQGIQGIQGKTGNGILSTNIQYQISNSPTTAPTGTWSNNIIATTTANPHLWMKATLNYTDGTTKDFYLVSQKGDKGDKGDTGDTGPIGPVGPVGSGLVVKGSVNDASQLPATGQEGYCYFVSTDLYIWVDGKWENMGNVSPDLSNYVTVTDLNNGLSSKADDAKVVHDNHNGTIQVNGSSFTPAVLDSAKGINAQPINTDVNTLCKPGLYYVSEIAPNNPFETHIILETRVQYNWHTFEGVQIAYRVSNTSGIAVRYVTPNGTLTGGGMGPWVILSDDSKVVHLSGANNFDTVPTVNNNPLLLASSLPSDLARTGQDQEFTGKNTFDTAPIDKTTGNPYITKDSVPTVDLSSYAKTSDVTAAISTATANMVHNVKGDTSLETIDGPKRFIHTPLDNEGYQFMTSEDVNAAISPLEQKIRDTGWQLLVSKDSSSAAFSSDSYYRIVNGIMYVHGTISVLSITDMHYQLWDMPTGWSISDKAGTQIVYPDSTSYNNYVQLNANGLLVYEDKTGYSTDFRFITPVEKA